MNRPAWFLLGCATAALQILRPVGLGFGRGWEMLNVAHTLVEKGYYGDPFGILATGPTAMVPPGFPILLSFLLRLVGDTALFGWSALALCLLTHGVYAMLLPDVGARLLGRRGDGEAAAALACLVPAFPVMPQWDTMTTTVGLLLYLLLTEPGERARRWFGLGAFAGVLSLFNPISLPITFLRALWMAPRRRKAALWMGAWAAGAMLAAAPWIVRNHTVLGTWNTRTNFGTTVFVSNNDCAQPAILATIRAGCYDHNHPNKDRVEAELVLHMGEAAYDARRTRDTLAWMRAHPRRTLELTAARVFLYWFPPAEERAPYAQAIWLTTLLAAAGLAWMGIDRARGVWFLAVASAVVALPYYLVVADLRYRVPVLWISQLCAGYLLTHAISWVRNRHWAHRSPVPSPPSAADTPTTAPGGAPSGSPSA